MYEAIVARVKTRPHPNADRVQLGDVLGYQVVVSKDTADGELGVFFPVDGQLSHDFCMANNLYVKHPETGEPMGGYFDKNRRIRAQRFRGEISEGLWVPLSYLAEVDTGACPKEGDRIGEPHCNKYETLATRQAGTQGKKHKRSELPNFPRHYDTPQLRENLHFRPDSLVVITEKLHGTSARTGRVMVPRPRWYHRAWNWIAARTRLPAMTPPEDLVEISGTRNCLLEPGAPGEKGQMYRQHWHGLIAPKLWPGEIVYYEIVGPKIMGSHCGAQLDKEELKLLSTFLGVRWENPPKGQKGKRVPHVDYNYGSRDVPVPSVWDSKAYVYRITRAGEDLTWYEVEARCEDLGLPTVPVLELVKGHEVTLDLCNELTRGASTLAAIPREGICLREEWTDEAGDVHVGKALKHKSYLFCALEGIRKNDEGYVDTEEAS